MNLLCMNLLCACPPAAEPADVPILECLESVGQIQKAVLQRIYSAPGVLNEFVIASANPNLLASWTPKLTASNSTKVVQTPYLAAPTTEPGAPRTYGGGNETLGGIELIIGREPTSFTANILRSSQQTIKALKGYQCENVGVFLIDEYGRIIGISDDIGTPTKFRPIPIAGFFVGDKMLGGLESVDMNSIQWKFFPNWSDNLMIVSPTDFNALVQLNTPS